MKTLLTKSKITEYLDELQKRFWYCICGLFLRSGCAFYYRHFFLGLLVSPIENFFPNQTNTRRFVFIHLREGFQIYIFLSILLGFYSRFPLFFIQLSWFLAPTFYQNELKIWIFFIRTSYCLLLIARYFRLQILFPQVWRFFLRFQGPLESSSSLQYIPSVKAYVIFCVSLGGAMLLSSQIPLLIYLLVYWKWIRIWDLAKRRRWVVISILVWAGLVSPPDVISQLILGIPLIIGYEFLLWFSFIWFYLNPLI